MARPAITQNPSDIAERTGPVAARDAAILVAAADERLVPLIGDLLRFNGYRRVRGVGSTAEVLSASREATPDVLLLDMAIAGEPGTSLFATLGNDPALRSSAVIAVLDASPLELPLDEAMLDAADWLLKPIHPRELLAKVERQAMRVLAARAQTAAPAAADQD